MICRAPRPTSGPSERGQGHGAASPSGPRESARGRCWAGVTAGRVQVVKRAGRPGYVINVATKQHWRQPAKIEYVRDGLVDLVKRIDEHGIGSIAVPPLGCGLGGLDWAEVRPLIVGAFEARPGVRLVLFEPEGGVKETTSQASRRGRQARSGGGARRG
jgi:O-acetyl-ADP-ribose deacetylase (regulator of RNase III)